MFRYNLFPVKWIIGFVPISVLSALALAQTAPAPELGILDSQEVQRILRDGGTGYLLDLNFMRLSHSALEDPLMFKEFAALNNCMNPRFGIELKSEFSYPKIEAFYREHAANILNSIPNTIRVSLPVALGKYDPVKRAFPLVNVPKESANQHQQDLVLDNIDPQNPRYGCPPVPVWQPPATGYRKGSGPVYRITVKSMKFSDIPADEATAKNYVESLPDPSIREATVVVDVKILPTEPKIIEMQTGRTGVEFTGEISKIVAFMPKKNDTFNLRTVKRSTGTTDQLGVLFP